MKLTKMLAGFAAFVLAMAAAVAVTKFYAARTPAPPPTPPPAATPPAPPAPPAPAPADAPATQVFFTPKLITLDLAARKSHTTLSVERDPARPTPERLWVRTYFFSSEGEPNTMREGEAVEIARPFADGDRAALVATAACGWCGEASAPRGGYYARVAVSTESKEAARLDETRLSFDIKTATPVVVEGATPANAGKRR